MDLAFSQEDLHFQEDVRNFLASEYPLDIKEKQDKRLPLEREDIIAWQKILATKGWFAINWPKEFGGTALSPTKNYILQNELASANTPILIPFGVNMCGPVVYTFGTEEQKKNIFLEYLTAMFGGVRDILNLVQGLTLLLSRLKQN